MLGACVSRSAEVQVLPAKQAELCARLLWLILIGDVDISGPDEYRIKFLSLKNVMILGIVRLNRKKQVWFSSNS